MVQSLREIDKQMVKDLTDAVESIGGTVEIVDFRRKYFKFEVADDFKPYLGVIVNEILTAYNAKRNRFIKENPFARVEEFIND